MCLEARVKGADKEEAGKVGWRQKKEVLEACRNGWQKISLMPQTKRSTLILMRRTNGCSGQVNVPGGGDQRQKNRQNKVK